MSVLFGSSSIISFSLLHNFTRLDWDWIFLFTKMFLGKPFLFHNSGKQYHTNSWEDICLEVANGGANLHMASLAINLNCFDSLRFWINAWNVLVFDLAREILTHILNCLVIIKLWQHIQICFPRFEDHKVLIINKTWIWII